MNYPVSQPAHSDHAHPWAMQLVIHRNKHDPANHLDVLEAVGNALVQCLAVPLSTDPQDPLAAAVVHWRAGWIRKVVRRAENKRWDDVQRLDGVTASSGSAQVRAFIPGPVSSVPPEIRKLQVGGTQSPRLHDSTQDDAWAPAGLTPAAALPTAKAAAPAGH